MELDESIASPQESAPSKSTRVSPLDLPSATTAVFVLIVVMTLSLILPLGASGSLAVLTTGLPLIVLLASLRLFLTMPDRWVDRNHMLPLAEIDLELAEWAHKQADSLGIIPAPTFLYTEQPGIPLQAFGTFRRRFVVVNKVELDTARSLGALSALKTMLTHELAHLKTGDTWKLQLAKQIIEVSSVLLMVLFTMLMMSRFSLERLLLSGPVGRADLIATVLSFPLIFGVMLYSMSVMQGVREHYADAWVLRAQGSDFGARNLTAALILSKHIWATNPSAAVKPTSWRSRLAGVTFARTPQRESLSRLKAITESRVMGAPFLRTMRQVAFVGGLAVGTQLFAFDTGTQLLFAGVALGGVYVGLAYLLPLLAVTDRTFIRSATQAVVATLMFMAGVCAFGLLRAAVVQAVYGLSGVHRPAVISMLQEDLARFIPLAVCALMLTISLMGAIVVIRWWYEWADEHKQSRRWTLALVLTAFAQSTWIFAAVATVAAVAVWVLRGEASSALRAFRPLAALLPLGIGLTLGVRWYTSRPLLSEERGRLEGQ